MKLLKNNNIYIVHAKNKIDHMLRSINDLFFSF